MTTKDVIFSLRERKSWSQDELAEKLYVTRQAVSSWETGGDHPQYRDAEAALHAL